MSFNKRLVLSALLLVATTFASAQLQFTKNNRNYDFYPGTSVLFYDDQRNDADSRQPVRWKTIKGTSEVLEINGNLMIAFLEGNAIITPDIAAKDYLPEYFTVSYEHYIAGGADPNLTVRLSADTNAMTITAGRINKLGKDSSVYAGEYSGKWHSIQLVYDAGTYSVYLDSTKQFTSVYKNLNPSILIFSAQSSDVRPVFIRNIEIRTGKSNLDELKMDHSQVILPGVYFKGTELNVKSWKPVNDLLNLLKEDIKAKFEIDVYADANSGKKESLRNTQQYADSFRAYLISQGIEESRLTAKGYGNTTPVSTGTGIESKMNNERIIIRRMK